MEGVRLGLVANTESGAADRAGDTERLLRDGGAEVEVVPLASFCDDPSHVDPERVAAAAARLGGLDRLVAAGGDGSLGPAALLALRAGVPLAVVPIGTANSFARWLELPLDLDEAVALALDPAAPTRTVEVADADGRPFVNVAATGLSVLAAERARPLKRRLGPLAYALGAARAAATARPLHTHVVCDGDEAWRGDAWQVVVAATGAFGGGSATGGVATDDHRLDVAIVEAGPRLRLLRQGYAMRRGRLVDDAAVRHVRGRRVEVRADGGGGGPEPPFNVDGEVLRLSAARFTVLGSVDVVVAG